MTDEEWGENEKKNWVEEVGEEKMAPVFSYRYCSYDHVGGAGRFLASLCPVKVNLVVYLG